MADDGLSDRERRKLQAMMAREAQAQAKAARRGGGGARPRAAPAPDAAASAPPPNARKGRGGGGPRDGVDRRKLSAERNAADLHARLDAASAADLAVLNAGDPGVVTIFSLDGYAAYARWKDRELEAMDDRVNANSLDALEARARGDAMNRAARREAASAPPAPPAEAPRPRKRAKRAPKRRKAPPDAPLPETPRSNEATASSGADSDDSDDVPLTHLARRTVVDL